MRSRCRPPTAEENCVDGTLSAVEAAYSIELYLRWLYLSLKEQSFDVNDEQSVQYIGSRQQCLYGCVCFAVMFFEMYSKFDAIGMKNVDWLTCIVLDSGCSELNRRSSSHGRWEEMVLRGIGGGKKSICQCVFDLVNTKIQVVA